MTIHPFPQLDVIQRAAQQGKVVFDCYRLLYNDDLWQIVIMRTIRLRYLHRQIKDNMVKELVYELKSGKFRFSQPSKSKLNENLHMKNILIIESVVVILEHIYHLGNFEKLLLIKNNPSFSSLQKLKSWGTINWFIKIKLKKIPFSQQHLEFLINKIKRKVNDQRFIQLVFYASMLSLQKQHHPYSYTMIKLSNLLEHIFQESVVQNLKGIIDAFERNNGTSIKLVFNKEEYLVGLNSTKIHANRLLGEINNELDRSGLHSFCDIQSNLNHRGDRIYFQNYRLSSKRNYVSNSGTSQQLNLIIPKQQMNQWASQKGYGVFQEHIPLARKRLLHFSAQEILKIYNEELISFANHCLFAVNFNDIEKMIHLAESSFLKTLAFKYKTTAKQLAMSMKHPRNKRIALVCNDKCKNQTFIMFIKMYDLKLHRQKVLQKFSEV